MREAIILAGGFGTRLREVISDIPKPMAPINGRPFLAFILDFLHDQDIEKVILATGYKHQNIAGYFGDRFAGIELEYSVEDEPLGTGGAIRKALSKATQTNVFVLNGDTFFPIDLLALRKVHQSNKADLTISLKWESSADRYGRVLVKDQVVVGFSEKTECQSGLINGGIYLVNRDIFWGLALPGKFSFENDFLACFYPKLRFGVYEAPGYFIDIGVPEDYSRAQTELGGSMKKALFLDRDGVINIEKNYVYRSADFEFMPGIFELLRYFQARGYILIIITNQAGIGRGIYSEADFHQLTEWLIGKFAEQAIKIDRVYFSPYHPVHGIGKYKKDDISRKPKPGMVQQAQKDFGINLDASILIGDKESDIEAGINAGIKQNILLCAPPKEFPQDTKAGRIVRELSEIISQCEQNQ